MSKSRIVVAAMLIGAVLSGPAMAASKMGVKHAAATMKCPACGMAMPMHKTAMASVPVKMGSKTYYCCPQCAAGQKAAKAAGMKHTKATM